MDWSLLTGLPALAAYGGFISSLRAVLKSQEKSAPEKALDVLVGTLMAVSVAEYFVPPETPKMAIVVGLIAGSFGGFLLDAVQAQTPGLVSGLIDGILGRLGYTRKPPNDDDKAA